MDIYKVLLILLLILLPVLITISLLSKKEHYASKEEKQSDNNDEYLINLKKQNDETQKKWDETTNEWDDSVDKSTKYTDLLNKNSAIPYTDNKKSNKPVKVDMISTDFDKNAEDYGQIVLEINEANKKLMYNKEINKKNMEALDNTKTLAGVS